MPTQIWREANAEKMRLYRREWYRRNSVAEIAKASERRRRNRKENREWVNELKGSKPCADCTKTLPPYVMEFDHLGTDKVANVSRMVLEGASRKRIEAEIAKCELVCSNCHAERTWQRSHT